MKFHPNDIVFLKQNELVGFNFYFNFSIQPLNLYDKIKTVTPLQTEFTEHFSQSNNFFEIDLFIALLAKMKISQNFYYKREFLSNHRDNLIYVLDFKSKEIIGFMWVTEKGEIAFFEVFEERRGLGTLMVKWLKIFFLPNAIYAMYPEESSIPFWKKVRVETRWRN